MKNINYIIVIVICIILLFMIKGKPTNNKNLIKLENELNQSQIKLLETEKQIKLLKYENDSIKKLIFNSTVKITNLKIKKQNILLKPIETREDIINVINYLKNIKK